MIKKDKSEKVIDAIERAEMTDDIKKNIDEADNYLLGLNNEKPNFLDDFLYKTKSMLATTVNRCIKSRNKPEEKDDLKKYKEGYFNEIIQNANDVAMESEIENPIIKVACSKESHSAYKIECTYPDNGFSLTDIYGFCSRGNSNKSTKKGQEGIYGIGIKSLFCFASYFCIENNIKIELLSTENLLDVINIEKLNRFPKETRMVIKFDYDNKNSENNRHAEFNVKKLANFIDALCEGNNVDSFLYSEEEEEVVFDPRSLMFTDLRDSRTVANSVKLIEFIAGENTKAISVVDEFYEESKDKIIKISKIKEDMWYLIFHYNDNHKEQNTLSMAYAINKDWTELNERIYSTYFVSNARKDKPLLEVKTGCLVNTKAINSSRSGLERENEKDPIILQKIKNKGKQIVDDLVNMLNTDNAYNIIASDVLCQLLFLHKDKWNKNSEMEMLPLGIFEGKTDDLRKMFLDNRLYLGELEKYIFSEIESDQIDSENGIILKNRPQSSSIDNCQELYKSYETVFLRDDLIFFNNSGYNLQLSFGIKRLCNLIFEYEDFASSWLQDIQLPFIKGAKNLLLKRVGDSSFPSIMNFILSDINVPNNESGKKLVRQLIARFDINNSFSYMGEYSNNNISNWLFSNDIDDDEFKLACREYEESYGELKKFFKGHIHTTKYYRSGNWNASLDCWYKQFNQDYYTNSGVDGKIINQFIYLLSKGILKVGYNSDESEVFINNLKNGMILRNRERSTTYWDGELEYFGIRFLNWTTFSFDTFKFFRKGIDAYNKIINEQNNSNIFNIDYLESCKVKSADITIMEDIFKWRATYKKEGEKKIQIDVEYLENIQSQETDIINFTKLFIQNTANKESVNVRLEKIDIDNNGANFIGYITNLKSVAYTIKYKESAEAEYVSIVPNNWNKEQDSIKNLIVFYTNQDEQSALSDVLSNLEYGNEVPLYIENFINTDNIKQLSSNDYDKYLQREERPYKYAFEEEKVMLCVNDQIEFNMEDIYTVLSGEMSYDNHCPICNDIPTLNIKGDARISFNKNCLVIIIPAIYNGKTIYVKSICCKSCFEEYKVSLTSAEIKKNKEQYILNLKNTICDNSRSYDFKKEIKLSPDNWRIICDSNSDLN